MKKLLLFILFLIIFLNACQKFPEFKSKETKSLSELQVTACKTADEAKTCDTRLPELGIVLREDCCKVLGKCC